MTTGSFYISFFKEHFMLIKDTCDSKSQTLRMRYPFQSTGRPISHRNGWSFLVYMIPLRDFVPEWNSRPGTRTGVNSRRGDSHRHDILWRYHVNKYRAMRGKRSELASERKSSRYHVKTPLSHPSQHNHQSHNILNLEQEAYPFGRKGDRKKGRKQKHNNIFNILFTSLQLLNFKNGINVWNTGTIRRGEGRR